MQIPRYLGICPCLLLLLCIFLVFKVVQYAVLASISSLSAPSPAPPSTATSATTMMMNGMEATEIQVDGYKAHAKVLKVNVNGNVVVVLLHGQAFKSDVWFELNIPADLAARTTKGRINKVVAVDLPGFGLSPPGPPRIEEGKALFLEQLVREIIRNVKNPVVVVVAPSMSGLYALPFIRAYESCKRCRQDFALKAVLVAPVGAASFAKDGGGSTIRSVETLLVWGGADKVLPASLAAEIARGFAAESVATAVIPNAPHPCYLQPNTDAFVSLLADFIAKQ